MDSLYKIIEIIGTSEESWDQAAKNAVEKACQSLEDVRVAEVISQDMKIEDGKIISYRVKLKVSFKFKSGQD